MAIDTNIMEESAQSQETPAAVTFAWFLLGLLLLHSDSFLITSIGVLLAVYGGSRLFFRGRVLALCIRDNREAVAKGEKPSMECLKDLLV